MKKGIAVVLALIMTGISMKIPGDVSMAVQMEESTAGVEETTEAETEAESEDNLEFDPGTSFRTIPSKAVTGPGAEIDDSRDNGMISLQIPQRISVVIDPWEMDGKGQIYSEQYVIRNVGETAGKLVLAGSIYSSWDRNGIVVRTDNNGIHSGQDKSIYMEMAFGNGDYTVYTLEEMEYEVRLEAGEELAFWFSGEVNEEALYPWKNGDFGVTMKYTWEEEHGEEQE